MTLKLLKTLDNVPGVLTQPGMSEAVVERVCRNAPVEFPSDYLDFLRSSNGLDAFHGYFRLFGMETKHGCDALVWNAEDCWKFAWQGRCSPYWCFGETAWGDQYAFDLHSSAGGKETKVYFLEGLSMAAEVIADSFSEFFENDLMRNAREPYDEMIVAAKSKFGALAPDEHLVYVPSLLLGGVEEIANAQKLGARAAMICNGDIALQLDAGPENGSVKQVESILDDQRRMRIKLVWA